MRKILTLIICLSQLSSFGQYGFSQTYEMNEPASSFHNTIWDGEYIVIAGTVRVDSLNQWGILFAQMDTLGNVINQKTYTDTTGDDYIFEKDYSLIHTSDDGYLITGNLWDKNWGFMVKLDSQGELEFLQEYPDTIEYIRNYHFKKVIELSDGYLIAGTKQINDYTSKTFVLKTDLNGNQIWEKKYGNLTQSNPIGSIQYIDENTYVIGSGNSHFPFSSPYSYAEDWVQGKIFAIDSLGNIKWEWESELNVESLVIGLKKTDNNEYIYTTGEMIIPNFYTVEGKRKVIKRDSNFNLIWSLDISPSSTPINSSYDIQPTPDGNYVVIGNWATPDSTAVNPLYGWYGACMTKFTEEGEQLWTRCDTLINTDEYIYNISFHTGFAGLTILPSGSIIVAGQVDRHDIQNQTARVIGWLFKVTPDGCLDTLCDLSTALFEPSITSEVIKVYPNPASEVLNIYFKNNQNRKDGLFRLIDINGRTVLELKAAQNDLEYKMPLEKYASGIYFLQYMQEGILMKSEKVVIAK
jgi:hypothetical protein